MSKHSWQLFQGFPFKAAVKGRGKVHLWRASTSSPLTPYGGVQEALQTQILE